MIVVARGTGQLLAHTCAQIATLPAGAEARATPVCEFQAVSCAARARLRDDRTAEFLLQLRWVEINGEDA